MIREGEAREGAIDGREGGWEKGFVGNARMI